MIRIQSAVLRPDTNRLTIEELDLAPPRAGEVLVRLVACGICHTDMVLRDASITRRPVVLGHEGAGIVEQVGEGVDRVQAGDRVILSFASCGRCRFCREHTPGYCEQFFPLNFAGARADGSTSLSRAGEVVHSHIFGQSSFSTHTVCAARNLVKVDDTLPLQLLGPFGCGFQTGAGAILNSLPVTKDSRVLILGAGSVGLAAVMAASYIAAAHTVIAADQQLARRQLAASVGASHTLGGAATELADQLRAICPQGLDVILDTTGCLSLIETCLPLLAPRGTLGLVASYAPGARLPVDVVQLFTGGRRIQGIMEGDSDIHTFIPALIEHYRQGRFPVDKLVRYYDFADINTAIADAESGQALKAVVLMR